MKPAAWPASPPDPPGRSLCPSVLEGIEERCAEAPWEAAPKSEKQGRRREAGRWGEGEMKDVTP